MLRQVPTRLHGTNVLGFFAKQKYENVLLPRSQNGVLTQNLTEICQGTIFGPKLLPACPVSWCVQTD